MRCTHGNIEKHISIGGGSLLLGDCTICIQADVAPHGDILIAGGRRLHQQLAARGNGLGGLGGIRQIHHRCRGGYAILSGQIYPTALADIISDFRAAQSAHGIGTADKQRFLLVPHRALCRAHMQEADNAPGAVLAQLHPDSRASKRAQALGNGVGEFQRDFIFRQVILKIILIAGVDVWKIIVDTADGAIVIIPDTEQTAIGIHEACHLAHDFVAQLAVDILLAIAGVDK